MAGTKTSKRYGARTTTINLSMHFNFPRRSYKEEWWRNLAQSVREDPCGNQRPWGIPFEMADESGPRAICVRKDAETVIPLNAKADFLCFLHAWYQMPDEIHRDNPMEGIVVAEYELEYSDGTKHVQPIRGRFEVSMAESPGPPWLAMHFGMNETLDPAKPPSELAWGVAQPALWSGGKPFPHRPLVYAMPNPFPDKKIATLTVRGMLKSPLLISGLTLYQGADHPLRHLPRRTYRIKSSGTTPTRISRAEIDLGVIARIERTLGPRNRTWLKSPYAGLVSPEPERGGEDLLEIVGAPDASVSVTVEGQKTPLRFSLGEAFHCGSSSSGQAVLSVLGKRRQWMKIRVIDTSTGKPTPVRVHMSGARGEYIAPYGHHAQINTNWFEDYGADVVVGGSNYAYVPGEFSSDMPIGDVFVEICKGYEYQPIRTKVSIKPGQQILELQITRWKDLRNEGWVTADTHVHFISPHAAWLEAQAEGVNVVNLLASQWGRLFTNVGDFTGRVGICENDTIVFVGTENRNHMLGHMSMLGTQGLPVYPMCCGGPSESWVGDPDFLLMAEWALENRRKGGLSIRPHFPYCGYTEDPVPILKGLVDALEIRLDEFAIQEWYRYLNCGYWVAVVGGTDKMSAGTALGWMRTYAKLDTTQEFTHDRWVEAVRAGRTVSTNGPLIDLKVEGLCIGDSLTLPPGGGMLEVEATAECFSPLWKLEIVHNGKPVAVQ